MKKNSKGFTLVETLIISSFVVGVLVYLFSQFVILKNGYNRSFNYNNVQDIYRLKNLEKYIKAAEASNIKSAVNGNSRNTIDITTCSNNINNYDYCKTLINFMGAKTVLVTAEDLEMLESLLENSSQYSEGLYQFVKNQNTGIAGNKYRLVVEFYSGSYATTILEI